MIEFNKGEMVEYVKGEIAEHIRFDGERYSFSRSRDTKWGAIGIVEEILHDGINGCCWMYKVRILWNDSKKLLNGYYIGANNENLKKLTTEEKKKWEEHFAKLEKVPEDVDLLMNFREEATEEQVEQAKAILNTYGYLHFKEYLKEVLNERK